MSGVSPIYSTEKNDLDNDGYGAVGEAGPCAIQAPLLSLPARGGGFAAAEYLGPDLAAFARAEDSALEDPVIAEVAAAASRSCHRVAPAEYVGTLRRLADALMVEFSSEKAAHPLGLFGVWKIVDEVMRLIVDGRPANAFFRTPQYVHTAGDSLAQMQVEPGHDLEVAKADLADFFHTCDAVNRLRRYFGLRPVSAAALRAAGVDVPAGAVDAAGFTHPRLTTLPMGFGPSPGIAQGAHEAVLYGSAGEGSSLAQTLEPVLDPAARWSSEHVPEPDSAAARAPHAVVVDDVLLFRQVPKKRKAPHDHADAADEMDAALREPGVALESLLRRYAEVGLSTKPSKVHDYAREQDLLGYRLDHNRLRISASRYANLRDAVGALRRRSWARPREVEALVGRFTHAFLLNRPALSVFSAVYAFAEKVGDRAARVWPSVIAELQLALDILPLVRADLERPVAPLLIQTDACDEGAAAVYTYAVPHADLRRECMRPRQRIRTEYVPPPRRRSKKSKSGQGSGAHPVWSAESALAAGFDAPTDPALWRVAYRRVYAPGSSARAAHINAKELGGAVDAVRWACRSSRTRRCRMVVELDSAVAVSVLRKGRSSRGALRRHCRRLAAMTLAEEIALEARWVPTSRNMADQPSRGFAQPGPCVESVPRVRPRGRGQGGYAARRVGEAAHPGPATHSTMRRSRSVPASAYAVFWTPLLDANINQESRGRYEKAAEAFMAFVREHGDRVEEAADLDYWFAYYAHTAYTVGRPSRGELEKALAGLEHWLPEFKPLPLSRRCMRGWGRLVPPMPAAPMPRDLAFALAATAALAGDLAAAIAMLLSHDCWLRISEVAGLTVDAVVDQRGAEDPVMRGVAVYLPRTKTGRRQAVRIDSPELAELVVAWRTASERAGARRLFPPAASLRVSLNRALQVLGAGGPAWETRGLHFVWHSFRHGGASRAYLEGRDMSAIILRGRWAAESSARHYVQAGRQMLLALALPPAVATLASRLARIGVAALVAPDLPERLRAAAR